MAKVAQLFSRHAVLIEAVKKSILSKISSRKSCLICIADASAGQNGGSLPAETA
jgi:hypothetical protein